MINTFNIFIVLIAPVLVGFFLLNGDSKRFIGFFLLGTIICLCSSYINSFIVVLFNMSTLDAIIKITPIIEEIMKSLPLIFYLIAFSPRKENIFSSAIALSIGFATLENCCHVVTNGASEIHFVIIRGFSVGVMHIICGIIIGFALGFITSPNSFSWLTLYASITLSISYHAIYNLLISGGDSWQLYGYFYPYVTLLVLRFFYIFSHKKRCY